MDLVCVCVCNCDGMVMDVCDCVLIWVNAYIYDYGCMGMCVCVCVNLQGQQSILTVCVATSHHCHSPPWDGRVMEGAQRESERMTDHIELVVGKRAVTHFCTQQEEASVCVCASQGRVKVRVYFCVYTISSR